MSRPKLLYDDVREICIQMVRGYDLRIFIYENGLEMAPYDPIAIQAVEEAKQNIGIELPESVRSKLVDAITLSCKMDKHRFRQEEQLTGISKSEFFNQRNRFLLNIALNLQLA